AGGVRAGAGGPVAARRGGARGAAAARGAARSAGRRGGGPGAGARPPGAARAAGLQPRAERDRAQRPRRDGTGEHAAGRRGRGTGRGEHRSSGRRRPGRATGRTLPARQRARAYGAARRSRRRRPGAGDRPHDHARAPGPPSHPGTRRRWSCRAGGAPDRRCGRRGRPPRTGELTRAVGLAPSRVLSVHVHPTSRTAASVSTSDIWARVATFATAVDGALDRWLAEHHRVGLSEYRALGLLVAAPAKELRIAELAHAVGLTSTSTTRLVSRLESK